MSDSRVAASACPSCEAPPFDLAKLRADAARMNDPVVVTDDWTTARLLAAAIGARPSVSKFTTPGEAILIDVAWTPPMFEMKAPAVSWFDKDDSSWTWAIRYGLAVIKPPEPTLPCAKCGVLMPLDFRLELELLGGATTFECDACAPPEIVR